MLGWGEVAAYGSCCISDMHMPLHLRNRGCSTRASNFIWGNRADHTYRMMMNTKDVMLTMGSAITYYVYRAGIVERKDGWQGVAISCHLTSITYMTHDPDHMYT